MILVLPTARYVPTERPTLKNRCDYTAWSPKQRADKIAQMGDTRALGRVQHDGQPQAQPGVDSGGGNCGIEIEGNSRDDLAPGEIYARHDWLSVHAAAAICACKRWDPMTRLVGHKERTCR